MKFICNQSWEEMAPTEHGRFCALCRKNVYDFTSKPVSEVLKLKASSGGELCGRFTAMQVYPDIIAPINISRFGRMTALLSTLLLLASRPSSAQTRDSVKTEQHVDNKNTEPAQASVTNKGQCDSISVFQRQHNEGRKINLFRIGRRSYFLTKRFPFIHSRSIRLMGFF